MTTLPEGTTIEALNAHRVHIPEGPGGPRVDPTVDAVVWYDNGLLYVVGFDRVDVTQRPARAAYFTITGDELRNKRTIMTDHTKRLYHAYRLAVSAELLAESHAKANPEPAPEMYGDLMIHPDARP